MNQYVDDFSKPEDQVSILNKLLNDCLESHAPTRRVKLTRPIAPWMKDPTIVSDRQRLELSRIKSRDSKISKEHQKYLEEKAIQDKKNSFFCKALSSKNPKIVWNSAARILVYNEQK